MAAPTNVRVEATSITTTTIRWDYSGSNSVGVWRSSDGSSYSEVTNSETEVAAGTTSYDDSGLSVGTKYWYKLSDDSGSTFSSVVTVFTHSCAGPISTGDNAVVLPRFDSQETKGLFGDTSAVPGFTDLNNQETIDRMNDMARRIEAAFNGQDVAPDACIACPEDGAVVLDCSSGCVNWTVIADQDINSVSINWCGKFDGNINFVIPANADVGICGFPAGFGFGGDECTQARFSGGTNGRRWGLQYGGGGGAVAGGSTSKPSTLSGIGNGLGAGAGGGGGGSGCTCVPQGGALTIKVCSTNNSLNCSSTTKGVTAIACGGVGPYTWSRTGSIQIKGSADSAPGSTATGSRIAITPPTNNGSSVGGTAYQIWVKFTATSAGFCENWTASASYNCDDTQSGCTTQADFGGPGSISCANGDITLLAQLTCKGCGSADGFPCTGSSQCAKIGCNNTPCADLVPGGKMCDKRDASMVSAGCNPCGLQAGSTITVTDATGAQATVILRA